MKKTLQLILFIVLVSCSTSKHSMVYLEHIDSKVEGDRFIDSLKIAGIGTVVGYYDGCSGCTQGTKTYFIYWESSEKWYLTKFTKYARFNDLVGYIPPIKYLSDNIEIIKNESLTKSNYELSHYSYEIVRIVLNMKEVQYEIKGYEKRGNESVQRVILIDKIRSALFEIQLEDWKGLNYKSEKRKIVYGGCE